MKTSSQHGGMRSALILMRGYSEEHAVQKIFFVILSWNQSLVAEWLTWWANLRVGVTAPLSDWEVVGLNPTSSMNRIGFFYPGKKFQWFSLTENVTFHQRSGN